MCVWCPETGVCVCVVQQLLCACAWFSNYCVRVRGSATVVCVCVWSTATGVCVCVSIGVRVVHVRQLVFTHTCTLRCVHITHIRSNELNYDNSPNFTFKTESTRCFVLL